MTDVRSVFSCVQILDEENVCTLDIDTYKRQHRAEYRLKSKKGNIFEPIKNYMVARGAH